jgi:hypothetical protein
MTVLNYIREKVGTVELIMAVGIVDAMLMITTAALLLQLQVVLGLIFGGLTALVYLVFRDLAQRFDGNQ